MGIEAWMGASRLWEVIEGVGEGFNTRIWVVQMQMHCAWWSQVVYFILADPIATATATLP